MPTANRLTQLTIKFISLVPAGANRREFIAKGDGCFAVDARVVKVDEALRQVTGALYPPGEVDTQGDFATRADVDLAMSDFQAKGRGAAGQACDLDHDERPTGDYIVECFKLAEGDTRYPGETPGTWIVTRQITDAATWAKVLDGTYKAFSFGGTAIRIPNVEVSKGAAGAPVARAVRALIAKGLLADMMARMEVPHLLDAACSALWDAFYGAPANTEDEKAAVAAVVAELAAELAKEDAPMKLTNTARKSLLDRFNEWLDGLGRGDAPAPPAPPTEPPAPAVKTAEELVAEAVEAAKADLTALHTAAVEALRAEHAAKVAELEDEITRLENLAPGSMRIDHNGTGDKRVSGIGVFAGGRMQ
jgi:hypothetical protein